MDAVAQEESAAAKDAFQRPLALSGWLPGSRSLFFMRLWLRQRNISQAVVSAYHSLPFHAEAMSQQQVSEHPSPQCSLLSLPAEAWYLIFDFLPERPATLFDEPSPSRIRTAGTFAVDSAALASTCRALNKFYRQQYVQILSLTRTVSPALLNRALRRHFSIRRVLLRDVTSPKFTSYQPLVFHPRLAAKVVQFQVVNEDISSSISKSMHSLPQLKVLTLVKCTALSGADVRRVARALAGTLVELNLDGTELGQLGAGAWHSLGNLTRLESLNISRWGCSVLPNCAFGAISRMSALRALTIQGDPRLGAGQLAFLPRMRRLSFLDLSCCAGLSSNIWDVMPARLAVLRLDWTSALHDGCAMSNLARLDSLVELAAAVSQQLTEWFPLQCIAEGLRELHLCESLLTDVGAAAVISRMTNLRALNLDQCNLVGDGVVAAAAKLYLESLNLCGTAVTIVGVQAVADGAAASTLLSLDLSCCDGLLEKDAVADLLHAALTKTEACIEVW